MNLIDTSSPESDDPADEDATVLQRRQIVKLLEAVWALTAALDTYKGLGLDAKARVQADVQNMKVHSIMGKLKIVQASKTDDVLAACNSVDDCLSTLITEVSRFAQLAKHGAHRLCNAVDVGLNFTCPV